jgi:hypothetical protein
MQNPQNKNYVNVLCHPVLWKSENAYFIFLNQQRQLSLLNGSKLVRHKV